MQTSAHILLSPLKQLVKYCQELQHLLQLDTDYFATHDLPQIEEANKNKITVIEQMNSLLQTLPSHELKSILSTAAIPHEKNTLQNTLNELKLEIQKCYQSMAVNNQIIYANIKNLKNVWDQILACQKTSNGVYDETGKIS